MFQDALIEGQWNSHRLGEGSEKAAGRMEHLRWDKEGRGNLEMPDTAATEIKDGPREAGVTG